MSRNAKILTAVAAVLLLMCVCGAVATIGALSYFGTAVARAVELNPAQIQNDASRIADFELPPGYRSEVAASIGGFLFVSYSPGDGHSHIMFFQAPADANLNQATLEQYAQQAAETNGYNRNTRTQIVGQQKATIRGQSVTLVVQEGTNSSGEAYRSLTGTFPGKGGTALLTIESPISRWDQAQVEAFLTSIR